MTQVKYVPDLVWTRKSHMVTLWRAMQEEQLREIAQRVGSFRDLRGWTQEELAYAAGVSNKTVSRLENGKHEPRSETLEKLAKALDVDAQELQPARSIEERLRGEGQLDRIEAKLQRQSDELYRQGELLDALAEQAGIQLTHQYADASLPEPSEEPRTRRAAGRAG